MTEKASKRHEQNEFELNDFNLFVLGKRVDFCHSSETKTLPAVSVWLAHATPKNGGMVGGHSVFQKPTGVILSPDSQYTYS